MPARPARDRSHVNDLQQIKRNTNGARPPRFPAARGPVSAGRRHAVARLPHRRAEPPGPALVRFGLLSDEILPSDIQRSDP